MVNENTARIPQDLTQFVAAGTITQDMLTDPNTLLRNHIASQNITSTTTLIISTSPATPLFGGGTDNVAFLLGNAAALSNPAEKGPNAQALSMSAVFWIETVEHVVHVPIYKPGQPPLTLPAETGEAGQLVPKFLVHPPTEITAPRTIKVKTTQIQYSQQVFLNFNGLTWPHVWRRWCHTSPFRFRPSSGMSIRRNGGAYTRERHEDQCLVVAVDRVVVSLFCP